MADPTPRERVESKAAWSILGGQTLLVALAGSLYATAGLPAIAHQHAEEGSTDA